MITGGTTPLGGATNATFQKRSVPHPPRNGWRARRSMALILPSSRRVESPKRWLMWREVATTSPLLPSGNDPLVCTGHNAPPRLPGRSSVAIGDMGMKATALPKAELAGVAVDQQVDAATDLPVVVPRTREHALMEEGRPKVEAGAVLAESVAKSAPLAAERVTAPDRFAFGSVIGHLCACQRRHDECHGQDQRQGRAEPMRRVSDAGCSVSPSHDSFVAATGPSRIDCCHARCPRVCRARTAPCAPSRLHMSIDAGWQVLATRMRGDRVVLLREEIHKMTIRITGPIFACAAELLARPNDTVLGRPRCSGHQGRTLVQPSS